jgi:hypothetical protein
MFVRPALQSPCNLAVNVILGCQGKQPFNVLQLLVKSENVMWVVLFWLHRGMSDFAAMAQKNGNVM